MTILMWTDIIALVWMPAVVEISNSRMSRPYYFSLVCLIMFLLLSLVWKCMGSVHGDMALLEVMVGLCVSKLVGGFGVDSFVLNDSFHGLKLLLHLGQMLGSNLIDMTQFVVCCPSLSELIMRKQLGNWLHVIRRMEAIFSQVNLKLVQTVLKGQLVKYVFTFQKLRKELILLCLIWVKKLVRVFLNHEDKFADHICLWTINVLRLALGESGFTRTWCIATFLVVRVVFGKVRVHPHFNLASFGDEDHFFDDIKVAHLFIQVLEAIQCGPVHVQQILEGDVVDLLQP